MKDTKMPQLLGPVPKCGQCDGPGETWCSRTDKVFLDNHSNGERPLGVVPYAQDEQEVTVKFSDGSIASFLSGPHPSYSAQLVDWAAQLAAITDNDTWERRFQGADGNPTTPFANHAGADYCAGDPVPVKGNFVTVGGVRDGRTGDLLVGVTEGDVETFLRCQCCGEGAAFWFDEDGNEVDPDEFVCLPVKSCSFPEIPEPEAPDCISSDPIPVCEIDPGDPNADPEVPPSVVESDIFLQFITCDGETRRETFTLNGDGDAEPYELSDDANYFGDCDTLALFDDPPPECPEDCIWECYEVEENVSFIDNNGWPNRNNLIRFDLDVQFRTTLVDGTVFDWVQTPTTGYTAQINQWQATWAALMPDCTFSARDTAGAALPGPPEGITPPAQIFRRHLMQECCDPQKLWATTEIIANSGNPPAGTVANHGPVTGPLKTYSRCEKCNEVFWKNSDGEIIPASEVSSCAKPCSANVKTALDCAMTECVDACAESAFKVTEGRPNNSVAWELFGPNGSEIRGESYAEFSAAMEADGYSEFIAGPDGTGGGEAHWFCPCPGNADDGWFIEADGETQVKIQCVSPNPNAQFSESECSLRTVGCNDDRRDSILEDILEATKHTPRCVKWSSVVVHIDNTGTFFNESHVIEMLNSDGIATQVSIPATSGWTPQLNAWSDAWSAAYPSAIVGPRCNRLGGCGGLDGPPSDAQTNLMIARYLSLVFCPTDKNIPVSATIVESSNPARVGKSLVFESISTPLKRGWQCIQCGDSGPLFDEDWAEVPSADIPACVFECSERIPSPPPANCGFDTNSEGCDNVGSTDPNDWVLVTRVVTSCTGSLEAEYYTEDPDGGLNEYDLVGEFVECDSGNVIPEPEPVCDFDWAWQHGCYEGEPVRWIEGIDCNGSAAYPNGAQEFYGCTSNEKPVKVDPELVTCGPCPGIVLGAEQCITEDGGEPFTAAPATTGGWYYGDPSGLVRVAGTVAIVDPCLCVVCCKDECLPGCDETSCGILRLDASPESLEEETLQRFTLEASLTNWGSCGDVEVDANFEGQTLTVIELGNAATIANFADTINAELGEYGFVANYCDQAPSGGTAQAGQGVAVQGPVCEGSPWEIKIGSGGTGDDFAIGYDGNADGQLHSHEWVNGQPITDESSTYSSDGGWGVRDCGDCAP